MTINIDPTSSEEMSALAAGIDRTFNEQRLGGLNEVAFILIAAPANDEKDRVTMIANTSNLALLVEMIDEIKHRLQVNLPPKGKA